MSYGRCCVPGCLTNSGSENALHNFPNPEKDMERFMSWLFNIGGDILRLPNEYIYKNRRVCHRHFEAKYECRFNRISNIAVPTVNMPGLSSLKFTHHESKRQRPLQQIDQSENKPSTSKEDDFMSVDVDMGCASSKILCHNTYTAPVRKPSNKLDIDNTMVGTDTTQSHDKIPAYEIHTVTKSKEDDKMDIDIQVNPDKLKKTLSHKFVKKMFPHKFVKRSTIKIKMSEGEKILSKQLQVMRRTLSKYKSKIKKQGHGLKLAKKLSSNEEFLKIMNRMPNTTKSLILLQFRELGKKIKGRRFMLSEKIIALSILKQSPKAYRFLRKVFLLPSPQTLTKLLSGANIKPGINNKIFAQLKKQTQHLEDNEKLCVLLFDEMSLKTSVQYNEKKDKVTGFVTNGRDTQPILANHAQVFMLRGLMKNYKMPVYYSFSSGATKGLELSQQIKEVITEIHKAGFRVVATVCDQGTNNRQAIKYLINDTRGMMLRNGKTPKDNVFIIEDKEIVPLYDPPHLLKGLRNNLVTKDLTFVINGSQKTAKWNHLQLFHLENPGYKGIRLVPKISDAHIVPHKIGKMKVKYASQVFSATLASNIGYLADKSILPAECKDTADLLLFVDELFDSVNGSHSKKRFAKPLLGPVKPNSIHHTVWTEAKKVLQTMRFTSSSGKTQSVPTINNWVWTLEGIETLLKKLKNEYNITSVWMRHLNQDPIENFFGAIRSHGCRNVNPTPDRFESAFTTLLINNLTSVHAPGGNCENDLGETLFTLVVDVADNDDGILCGTEVDINHILDINLEPLENKLTDPKIMAPLQYISGYFVYKTKKIFKNCPKCESAITSKNEIEYIQRREYAGRRWLCTPHDNIIEIVSHMQDVSVVVLRENFEKTNLKSYIKTVMLIIIDFNKITFCEYHNTKLLDYLINLNIRFFIYNYCKTINRILSGNKDVEDDADKFQKIAKESYKKSLKIKKRN